MDVYSYRRCASRRKTALDRYTACVHRRTNRRGASRCEARRAHQAVQRCGWSGQTSIWHRSRRNSAWGTGRAVNRRALRLEAKAKIGRASDAALVCTCLHLCATCLHLSAPVCTCLGARFLYLLTANQPRWSLDGRSMVPSRAPAFPP
jgi:hypothetical protein